MGNRWPPAPPTDTFKPMTVHADNQSSILQSPLFAGFLIPLLGFLPAAMYLRYYSIDDVFISFRYAAHLAQGHGLEWNLGGAPVEGFSNFLWVIILAAARLLGFDIVSASEILGFCLGIANLWLFGLLCRRLWPNVRYWWLPVMILAVNPEWVMWTMSGLEIALFCLFLLISTLALTADRRRRVWLLSVGLAGLSLTRPEGFALAVIPLACGWFADRHQPLRTRLTTYGIPAIALVVATLGLVLFRLSYFGYPLPNTVYAKGSERLRSVRQVGEWIVFGIPFYAAWLLAARARRNVCHAWVFASSFALIVLQIIIVLPVNPVMYFMHRYQIAFFPLLILPLPLLLVKTQNWRRWAGPALGILIFVWTLQGWPESSRRSRAVQYTMEKQLDVAAYLLSLPDHPTIATCDAGRIPYWTDLPTHDVAGLCDTEWGHGKFSVASLLARHPSAYVMSAERDSINNYRPFVGRDNFVMQTAAFRQNYGLGQMFPKREGEIEGDYGYAVFLNVAWARQNGLNITPLESPP